MKTLIFKTLENQGYFIYFSNNFDVVVVIGTDNIVYEFGKERFLKWSMEKVRKNV